jgi:hypothetical protein
LSGNSSLEPIATGRNSATKSPKSSQSRGTSRKTGRLKHV